VIARFEIRVEMHRGYRPRLTLRRIPKAGDRVTDGGVMGTLETCPECGDGLLHRPDVIPAPVAPRQG
jgi:hypothetical protein